VRLKDLEGLEQEECAKKMNIFQPTFHRLVLSARKKISDAIVNGKAIKMGGILDIPKTIRFNIIIHKIVSSLEKVTFRIHLLTRVV